MSEKYLELMSDQYWRLNHLYKIVDINSNTIPFIMNEVQEEFYQDMWYWNIILKARQLGFSQFISILGLDYALFNDNVSVEIIAHTLNDAIKIFDKKIKFVYDNLPEEVQSARPTVKANVRQLKFNNNSVISVGTSARSDVINFLHISELAKICSMRPDRAREIITGSLPAVHPGSLVFIESTAEGALGYFYDICKEAEDRRLRDAPLNKRQIKFHFFPWHRCPSNRLDPKDVMIYPWQTDYFKDLELKYKIELDDEQKAWYANECMLYEDDIKREDPSFSAEAFWESAEGAYYLTQFRKIRSDDPCRICPVPYIPGYPVDTWWDLGVGDSTAIWSTQTVGRELHWINYYENSGEGLEHYINILREYERKFNYAYGRHGAPPDIAVREFGNNAVSRLESAKRLGIKFEVCPSFPIDEGIEAVRQTLGVSWFDEEKCELGIRMLESYRKEWDVKHGRWKDKPRHDEACLIGSTKIRTLNGWIPIENLVDKEFYVWSYDIKQHRLRPAKVNKCWKVGVVNKFIEVMLDNGEKIVCTPEHKFMMRDESWKEAKDLLIQDSLMPFYETCTQNYIRVSLNDGTYADEHLFVYSEFCGVLDRDCVIHHKDDNKRNCNPENLIQLTKAIHIGLHSKNDNRIQRLLKSGKHKHQCSKTAIQHLIQMNKKRSGDNHHTQQDGYPAEEIRVKLRKATIDRYSKERSIKICPICNEMFWGTHKRIYCCDACKGKHQSIQLGFSTSFTEFKHTDLCTVGKIEELQNIRDISNHKVIDVIEINEIHDIYDIQVDGYENFVAEGVVIHNSHSADAARICALMWKQPMHRSKTIINKRKPVPAGAWT